MYETNYGLSSKLTDYQIEILMYLKKGCMIVTNEGRNFSVWLEKDGLRLNGIPIRKDSADKVLSYGLMELLDDKGSGGLYYYKFTEKANKVFGYIDERKLKYIEDRAYNRFLECMK